MRGDGDVVAEGRRRLLLRGLEYGARLLWSWEWDEGDRTPGFAIWSSAARTALLDELDRALPEALPDEAAAPPARLREQLLREPSPLAVPADHPALARFDTLLDLVIADRCARGALANARREAELMARLGAELLPTELVADIRRARGDGVSVELRIMPTPDCAHVPWGLLASGRGDERLIEICDVVMLVPASTPPPTTLHVADREASLPLYVVDPDLTLDDTPQVLTREGREEWADRIDGIARSHEVSADEVGSVGRSLVTRLWLSERLHSRPRSRFVYIGHVTTPPGSGMRTSLELNDPREVYSIHPLAHDAQPRRPFTASDALAGTRGAREHLAGMRAESRRAVRDEFGQDPPEFPAVDSEADAGLAGAEVWPMPPRVAIIGCRSGVDVSHGEPFGLVSAMMQLGAEVVIATRWSLLADAVELWLQGEDPDLTGLLHRLDEEVLASASPIESFARWQRARLAAWRAAPTLSTAPLGFAALALHTGG